MRIALIGDLDARMLRGLEPTKAVPTQTPALNLVRGFRQLGLRDVHIVIVTPEVRTRTVEEGSLGVVHRLPCPPFSGSASFFLWRRQLILRELRRIEPDVVHGQGTEREHAFSAVTSPYPHAITIHGVMHRVHELFPPPLFSTEHVARWLEGFVVKRARDVICISPETEEFLVKSKSPARRHRIPNAIAPCFFELPAGRRGCGTPEILFVGSVMERKGIGLLVEALPRVQQRIGPARLRIAAKGGGPYEAVARARAAELGVAGQIDWLGPQNELGVAEALERAAVLALPSFVENMPMCIGEAMASAVPVVATTVGGIPQMVEHGKTGLLVAPGKTDELVDALVTILSDPELRLKMGQAGREKACREYAPRVVAEKTLEVYQMAISDARQRL